MDLHLVWSVKPEWNPMGGDGLNRIRLQAEPRILKVR